jgi:taurine dioxygenase
MGDPGGVEVVALTRTIGAELTGVDLGTGRDPASVEALHAALRDHHVVIVRDQQIGPADLTAIAETFGQVEPSAPARAVDGFPSVSRLATHAGPAPDTFHLDDACGTTPPAVTLTWIESAPPIGGDALFADLEDAYDSLSGPMRELVDGLRVVNDVGSMSPTPRSAEHPLVRVHPDTGRRSLFFDCWFSTRIVGLTRHESDAVMAFLRTHVADDAHTCRIRWIPGTLAIWDSRCTSHYSVHDFDDERVVLTARIAGDVPSAPAPSGRGD